jgi:hypothetical protein
MNKRELHEAYLSRRGFFHTTGAGLAVAGMAMGGQTPAVSDDFPRSSNPAMRELTQQEKLDRIASNSWPIRDIFKTASTRQSQQIEDMKKKYGEITMLDFPDFTKSTFPGVTHMDIFSGLFGDVTDPSMFLPAPAGRGGPGRGPAGTTMPAAPGAPGAAPAAANPAGGAAAGGQATAGQGAAGAGRGPGQGAGGGQGFGPRMGDFDPSSASGKKWLDRMASKLVTSGTRVQHISNNAPTNLCVDDVDLRKHGVQVAKNWMDAAGILGAKSMRVNSGGPTVAPTPIPRAADGYPKNDDLARLLSNCIDSFKEIAEYGAKVGTKVTLENHWGLTANPINIQIIIDEVHSPFCEASPDFFNWEHDYLCYHGLAALAPYAHTNVHAKYWNRWATCDVQRCVRIMESARFTGTYALEYEDGPWDRVEGAKYLYKEVLAAL